MITIFVSFQIKFSNPFLNIHTEVFEDTTIDIPKPIENDTDLFNIKLDLKKQFKSIYEPEIIKDIKILNWKVLK
jgi:hypothetical protein